MIGAAIVVLVILAGGGVAIYLRTSSKGSTGIIGSGITGTVVGVASDGTLVTADNEGGPEIRYWNGNTSQEVRKPTKLPFSGTVAISKDGLTAAVASEGCAAHTAPCPPSYSEAGGPGSRVRIYNTVTGQQTCVIEQTDDSPYNVVFTPDGSTVALSGFQGAASLWDAKSCQLVARLESQTNANVTVVAISPDGGILAGGGTSRYVDLWNVATHELKHRIDTGQTGNMMATTFSPDGRLLATSANDGTLRIWDVSTFEEVTPAIRMGGNSNTSGAIQPIAFSPDGIMIGGVASSAKGVTLWDARSGQVSNKTPVLTNIDVVCFAFSADGTTIYGSYLAGSKFGVISGKLT